MRYDHFSLLPVRAFQKRAFGGMTLEGGGGGGGQPTASTVTQTNIPEYAKPYVENMLGATQQQLFNVSPEGQITGIKSYTPYSQDPTAYVAGFSPMQEQSMRGIAGLQMPEQYGAAMDITGQATQRAMDTGYRPGYFGNQFQSPGQYAAGRFSMLEAQAPELQQYQMGAPDQVAAQAVGTPTMEAAQTGYTPGLQQYQMGPAERVSTSSFTEPGAAGTYMSPYMQNVVDVQKREAQRASNIAGQQQRAQAVGAGAFGGTRQALVEAERQRNLATQLGDIQATGSQAAYQQAQQQFNQEQQARMQAALANQQAGLTVGGQNLAAQLGVQQLGTQTGVQTALANLSSQQQANVQNQAAALQAQGMNAQQALQAALANQQAGITVGGQNLAALLGTQQLGAGQNLQAQLANQQAMQAAQQAAEQSRQYGYGQAMTAAQQRAQYGLAGQQLGEQSRQYGAGLGLQGLGLGLQGANQLAGLGGQALQTQQGIYGLQNQYGAQQQAQQQNIINQAIQNYATAQQYPQQQLAFMNAMLRGLPLQTATTQAYQAPMSPLGLLGGIGGQALGGYMARTGSTPFKKGGIVDTYSDGGDTEITPVQSQIEEKVLYHPEQYSADQIKQSIQNGIVSQLIGIPVLQQKEKLAQQMAMAQAMNKPLPQQPINREVMNQGGPGVTAPMGAGIDQAQIPQDMFSAAGGGIVAFANNEDQPVSADMPLSDEEIQRLSGPITTPPPRFLKDKAAKDAAIAKDWNKERFPSEKTTPIGERFMNWLVPPYKEPPKPTPAAAPAAETKAPPPVAKPPAAPIAPKPSEELNLPPKEAKKAAIAEDKFEKAILEALGATTPSEKDEVKAAGRAIMRGTAQLFGARRGQEGEKISKGFEEGLNSYDKYLENLAKDKKELSRVYAEYGLGKQRVAAQERETDVRREIGLGEIAARDRATAAQQGNTAEAAASRRQVAAINALQKYEKDWKDLYGMQPKLTKDDKPNPRYMSFEDYLNSIGMGGLFEQAGIPRATAPRTGSTGASAKDFYKGK